MSVVHPIRRVRLLVGALLTLALLVSAGGARAAVPAGFVGMNIDGLALSPQVDLGRQFAVMRRSGVQRVRAVISWADAQPYPSRAAAPPTLGPQFVNVRGVPTSFAASDRIVALAAAHGLPILPVVVYAPRWAAEHPEAAVSPPQEPATYGRFLAALVARYGPGGTFWATHPAVPRTPVHWWQIWNEPDLPYYWPDRPWQAGYVRLLHAAHDAVKAADPTARIVLAGTPDYSWTYLDEMYGLGARPFFDVVAAHPYTAVPGHVIGFLDLVRRVMDRHGDRAKPLIATEVSFPSSRGKAPGYGFATDERGQAVNTARTMALLAAHRSALRLAGFYIYTWIGDEAPGKTTFAYSGLFRFAGPRLVAKPVFPAFRREALRLEHGSA